MSCVQLKLAALLLREHYGEIVENVGTYLIENGARPLRVIALDTAIKVDQIRKALCVLIQHNIVKCLINKRGIVEYQAEVKKILLHVHTRNPKYIFCTKTLFGDAGEIIVEELLQNGQMLMSAAIHEVTERLNEVIADNNKIEESFVRDKFIDLVNTHFVQRIANLPVDSGSSQSPLPDLDISEKDLYEIPMCMMEGGQSQTHKRKRSIDEEVRQRTKRQRTDSTMSEDFGEVAADNGIYWSVNHERFHQHIRDQIVIEAVAARVDKIAGEVVRTMLRISEVTTDPKALLTTPMSSHEIYAALPKELKFPRSTFDQYLKLLADDQMEIVNKCGESGGGMYAINIYKAIKVLCTAHVESVVQERFGSKCFRIFRLLLLKKHLEQKQVEEFAMIPAKEAKELLYSMFSEHIVALQEIPRTPDHAPSRTIYLFSVNLNEVSRMLLERCYKAQMNMIARRDRDNNENKRLLEKSQRVEAITASLQSTGADADEAAEVEEMITPPERAQLNKLKNTVNKLEQTVLQLDETVFILNSFIHMVV